MFLKNFQFVYFLIYGLVKYLPTPIGEVGRWLILKCFLSGLGWKTYIRDGVTIWYPKGVKIGRNSSLNEFVHLNGAGGIEIGEWVRIAHGTSIISEDHVFDDAGANIAEQGSRPAKVTIHDNVWIGAGVRILKGVTIGKGAVIGAGAVVTKDIPAGAIAVGNPAKVIRYRKGMEPSEMPH
jgi:acetyltransferase-like isoleucine patch superfamily enzyme